VGTTQHAEQTVSSSQLILGFKKRLSCATEQPSQQHSDHTDPALRIPALAGIGHLQDTVSKPVKPPARLRRAAAGTPCAAPRAASPVRRTGSKRLRYSHASPAFCTASTSARKRTLLLSYKSRSS